MFLLCQIFLNDLACQEHGLSSVIRPQSPPGSLLCEVFAFLSTTGTDRFGRKLTHRAGHALLSSEASLPAASRSWGGCVPRVASLILRACAQRSRFPWTLAVHQSSQGRVAGAGALRANCLCKDSLVPHSPAQETAYRSTRVPSGTTTASPASCSHSCEAPCWFRGHHQGCQPPSHLDGYAGDV